MPQNVTRNEVLQLAAEGGQIVEVLPSDEYDERHIAGAISIPLRTLGERAPDELDPSRPVITYCHDYL